jgi:hypothetical protein
MQRKASLVEVRSLLRLDGKKNSLLPVDAEVFFFIERAAEFDLGASHGFPGVVPVKRAGCLHLALGMGVCHRHNTTF